MGRLDYEKDMMIDEMALDVECLNQPRLMMFYAEEAAKVRGALDSAKEGLDIIEAETDAEIRKDPEKFGISKITEAAIKGAITLDADCQEARRKFLNLKMEADLVSAAQRALDARKKMLELLVQLHGQQYFAGPKVPRDISAEARKRMETNMSNEKVKSAMRRNK